MIAPGRLLLVAVFALGFPAAAFAQSPAPQPTQTPAAPGQATSPHRQHQHPSGHPAGTAMPADHREDCHCCCCQEMMRMMHEHGGAGGLHGPGQHPEGQPHGPGPGHPDRDRPN